MSSVIIISAPSGSGKSTLVNRLLASDERLLFSISYTTRPPRGQEQDGQQYYFISRGEFEELIHTGQLLEWAEVFGNYYGTHRDILERSKAEARDVVLDIDVQGARQLKERIPGAVSVFILPPSKAELLKRLQNRSEDSVETIKKRLQGAVREICDYNLYDYVVVNEDLDKAFEQLKSIVQAERLKTGPGIRDRVERILKTFSE